MCIRDRVFVLVNQGLPHPRSMFLIHAKDDGFLEAIAAFLEEIRDFFRDELGAVVDNERAVEIPRVVDAVLDLIAVPVHITPLRSIAMHIYIDMDLDHLVWRQEAVLDALPEGVGVNRRPEIMNIGNVLRFLGRGSESDLGSGCLLYTSRCV